MSRVPGSVVITRQLGNELDRFFGDHTFSKVAVIVDENTRQHCLPAVAEHLPAGYLLIEIKSGEEEKNLETCAAIWQSLTDAAFDRKSLVVNLGGGVIGDMGGFCAATFKRGIAFINIPTTLLAQVDASVGGKLGIDFRGLKNHIGVFQEPLRVFITPLFLESLSTRELRSGYAEVIKHCLIADHDKYVEITQKPLEKQDWHDLISHSVQVKNAVVTEDPQEKGLRKILNFGHTLGHAIETYYLNKGKRILHGEAIAIGMVCESWLSTLKCGMDAREDGEIFRYLGSMYDLRPIDEGAFGEIIDLTLQDKKNDNNIVKASLLQNIGKCLFDIPLSGDEMSAAMKNYNERLKVVETK